jgi:hypothetical protein
MISAVHCSAVQCSAVQCTAVHCSAVPVPRPAIIVRPAASEDVAIVVSFAVRHGFQVSWTGGARVQCSAVQYSAVQCSAE